MSGNPRLILLANFYGSYLDGGLFDSVAIVNNAGIEQLASLGVDRIKELKSRSGSSSSDTYIVLIVAGLTDVLIKSVEEGKNKLEITPNSTQLIGTKMEWTQSLLINEGAIVLWATMPPINLKMYHQSEGWNVNRIPGMSAGLEREQAQLNGLMLNYRHLCLKLMTPGSRELTTGLFFTDLVTELSRDRKILSLVPGFFESDGISPGTRLKDNWNHQVQKLVATIKQSASKVKHGVSSPSAAYSGPGNKRDYSSCSASFNRGLLNFSSSSASRSDPAGLRGRDWSPPPKVPAMPNGNSRHAMSSSSSGGRFDNQSHSARQPGGGMNPEQLATAVKLLAAMSGTNVESQNLPGILNMMSSYDGRRRQEEEQAAKLRRQAEEERLYMLQKKLEEEQLRQKQRAEEERRRIQQQLEEQYREEMRRKREEELKRKIQEEQRLRDIQIAAQRALEQRKLEQREREKAEAMKRQSAAAAQLEKKAKAEAWAVATQLKAQISDLPTTQPTDSKPSALERINEKLQNDRKKREEESSQTAKAPSKVDLHIAIDRAWKAPVVLFSFVNRNDQRKPLRGVAADRLSNTPSSRNDWRSRGQHVYKKISVPTPLASYLKIKVRTPGELTEFETRVAQYNNKLMELMLEADRLVDEGKFLSYHVRKEVNSERSKRGASTNSAEESSTNGDDNPPSSETKTKQPPTRRDKKTESSGSGSARRTKSVPNSANRNSDKPRESSLPPAPVPKPRWDKSDESDDDLIWDDDEPQKLVMDDEDDGTVKEDKSKDPDAEEAEIIEPVTEDAQVANAEMEIDDGGAAEVPVMKSDVSTEDGATTENCQVPADADKQDVVSSPVEDTEENAANPKCDEDTEDTAEPSNKPEPAEAATADHEERVPVRGDDDAPLKVDDATDGGHESDDAADPNDDFVTIDEAV